MTYVVSEWVTDVSAQCAAEDRVPTFYDMSLDEFMALTMLGALSIPWRVAEVDAVAYLVLRTVRDSLRSVSFEPVPGGYGDTILTDNIILRKLSVNADNGMTDTPNVPGIVISLIKTVHNSQDSNNEEDAWAYHVAIEIIANDIRGPQNGLRTTLMWQQKVRRRFNYKYLIADTTNNIHVENAVVREADPLDERQWVPHDKAVSTTVIEFLSREPRTNT